MAELEEKEDRISDLPDSLIQHIISFLPSIREAIRTEILSKRWLNQWTCVPVLILNFTCMLFVKPSVLSELIDNILVRHDCSKIKKFGLIYYNDDEDDTRYNAKIRFAATKGVEELNLVPLKRDHYMLPEFLFNICSLVKLRTYNSTFRPNGKVNWGCLTELNIEKCNLNDQAMEHILSGSPLLKSLELNYNHDQIVNFVIASEFLERLVLLHVRIIKSIEISCPKLVVLTIKDTSISDLDVFARAIENVLYFSSLLQSLELIGCLVLKQLAISSRSLKRLVIGNLSFKLFYIEISCPKLEKLEILGELNLETAKFLNLPSALCATFDFHHVEMFYKSPTTEFRKSLIKDILGQFQHVRDLKIGSWIIKVEGLLSPALNVKCLTLDSPYLNNSGIACVLRHSHVLEKLVIKMRLNDEAWGLPVLSDIGENYWNSDITTFDCLVSHLKTIRIIGVPKKDDQYKRVLNFVQFLLKNARVLEKMVVELKDDGRGFPLEVSQELLSMPRCSESAIVEFL